MVDSPPAIQTRSLQKIYRSGFFRRPFVGLEGLDLTVEQGEVFGFIGPNGAGKTTAIKCLMGLHHPTGGEARIFGRPIGDPESRREVGFLPERPYFYQHLTAREFLDFYGQLFDIPAPVRRQRAEELLERVALQRFADVPLRLYSKGMLQRAGVAQALINRPRLVVLDEPMSGLDPLGRVLIRDLILEERQRGCTVFFSSHILSDVQSICDRVALVVGGGLKAVGRVEELLRGQVEHVECTVVLPEGVVLRGLEVTRNAEERLVRVPPGDVDDLLRQVHAAGGRVLQVTPARRNLEDLLMGAVERHRPVDRKRMGVLA